MNHVTGNALEKRPQLRSLHLTLKHNDFMRFEDLEFVVLQNIKRYQMSTRQIELWAKDLLQACSTALT